MQNSTFWMMMAPSNSITLMPTPQIPSNPSGISGGGAASGVAGCTTPGVAGTGCVWRIGVALLTAPLGVKPTPEGSGGADDGPRGGSRTMLTSNTGLRRTGEAWKRKHSARHNASDQAPVSLHQESQMSTNVFSLTQSGGVACTSACLQIAGRE